MASTGQFASVWPTVVRFPNKGTPPLWPNDGYWLRHLWGDTVVTQIAVVIGGVSLIALRWLARVLAPDRAPGLAFASLTIWLLVAAIAGFFFVAPVFLY